MKYELNERVLPNDLDAEAAALGCMMYGNSAAQAAAQILQPEYFYRDAHRLIFETFLQIMEVSEIDIITATSALRQLDIMENVGGTSYLVELQNAVPTAANVEHYCRIVADLAGRRRLIDELTQMTCLAYGDTEESYSAVLDKATKRLSSLQEVNNDSGAVFARGEALASDIPAYTPAAELWFGLYPGKAHMLLGESGAGKSTLLYKIAIYAARNEKLFGSYFGTNRPLNVLYVDPENAGNFRAEKGEAIDGGLCRRKLDNILEPGETLPPTLVFHDGQGLNLSLEHHRKQLIRRIKRGVGGRPFDIIILDPLLTLFAVTDENSNAEMGKVSDALRDISRLTGAAVIAAHHTGKASMGGVLSGRGASSLVSGQDVVLTWRARGPKENEVDDTWSGEQKIRRDVCRLRIEKDRIGAFGTGVSLYLRMGGDGEVPKMDRLGRASFEDWKDAESTASDGDDEKSVERARAAVLEVLSAEHGMNRNDIAKQLQSCKVAKLQNKEIGSRAVNVALKQLGDAGTINRIRLGKQMVYSLKAPPEPENPESTADSLQLCNFATLQNKKTVAKDDLGAAELIQSFMPPIGEPPPQLDPDYDPRNDPFGEEQEE